MAYQSNYQEEIFKKFDINNRGEYIIMKKLKNSKGNIEFYDFRKYYTPEDGNGELRPTKQGLRLNYENMVEFMDALLKNVDEDVMANFDKLFSNNKSNNQKQSEPLEPITGDDLAGLEDGLFNLEQIDWEDENL